MTRLSFKTHLMRSVTVDLSRRKFSLHNFMLTMEPAC